MLPPLASVRNSGRAMLYSVVVPVCHRVEPMAQGFRLKSIGCRKSKVDRRGLEEENSEKYIRDRGKSERELVYEELQEPGHHLAPPLHPVTKSLDSLEGGRALFPLKPLSEELHAIDPLGGML